MPTKDQKVPSSETLARIQRPVRRAGADRHILLTLFSFGVAVAGTRLFLELTGYPQLGGGEYHIAHVLWGGLGLFVASLLPLVFANQWVYHAGAVLAGVGAGLFIDEVGKFITSSNDYFHPAAAPIVYAFFLLTVLIYTRVRKPALQTPRDELYRAMHGLLELLDHDLEPEERELLLKRLRYVEAEKGATDLSRLANLLREFLEDESTQLAPDRISWLERGLGRLKRLEDQYLSELRTRAALIGALLALAAWSAYGALSVMSPSLARSRLEELVLVGRISSETELGWFAGQLLMQVLVGAGLTTSALTLLAGRRRLGVQVGSVALVVALTAVNLFVFYFDQFSTILKATIELTVFLALRRYADRFPEAQTLPDGGEG